LSSSSLATIGESRKWRSPSTRSIAAKKPKTTKN
jgi:hypothetical protein